MYCLHNPGQSNRSEFKNRVQQYLHRLMLKLHTAVTNASNLQKHYQFVCLSDSLRKQSTIGPQGAIDQQNVIIYNFVQRA